MGPISVNNNNVTAYMELQKPIYHRTMDMNIRKFKTEVRRLNPKASKGAINRLILAYKKRAWMEADGVTRGLGSIPTHPKYGKKIEVKTTEDEYKVKVRYA